MAAEELFTSSAILSIGMIATFVYLFSQAQRSEFWKHVWLAGVFMVIFRGLAIEAWGWQHAAVATDLSSMTYTTSQVLVYMVMCVLGWLVLTLALYCLKGLIDLVTGKNEWRNREEQS